jgi:hypothetical protein
MGRRRHDRVLMFDRGTQLKIMLVGLLFSTAVACVCLFAKPQQPPHTVVKAERIIRTAGNGS